jgi:hypothetical protein
MPIPGDAEHPHPEEEQAEQEDVRFFPLDVFAGQRVPDQAHNHQDERDGHPERPTPLPEFGKHPSHHGPQERRDAPYASEGREHPRPEVLRIQGANDGVR